MPGIGVISNPNAGLNKLYPNLKNRLTFIVGRGGEVASTGTLDDAERAAAVFKRYQVDMLAISGGDGTAHRTIELLLKVYDDQKLPPILLLPSGTQNMVPGSFGIRASSTTALLLTLARYRHNVPLRCVRRNMLKVNRHNSFMFGLGIAPRFLELYYSGEKTKVGAAKLIGKLVVDVLRHGELSAGLLNPINASYRLDKGPWQEVQMTAFFSSFIEELSLRSKIFPRAGWDPEMFESMLVNGNATQIVRALPILWSGSPREVDGFMRLINRSIELRLDHPESYTLDGELYPATDHFTITAGPELRFVVPGLKLFRADPRLRWGEIGPWDLRFLI
jgi:diacylglycerol kinase family enzyme